MYNRYIPQPDGSYSRRRMQEPRRQDPPPPPPPPAEHCPPQPQPCPESVQKACEPPKAAPSPPTKKPPSCQNEGIPGFLRQLLPKGLDTGDLFVLLLLLLMAGDCREDQNTAMLTLALYLFM